eukprot:CAMPEP_0175077768 /NCGR_PEP_ID=MMETSP0052_2-20121109/23627_1 /TAXON_ID=51329 ORGANISM="Polytomella parva, Strain SAG 63-3" /NCGR_SAMPLE_ID=MMETSP0052_2 /ASSEMBLY_ACC=CAM_ASM_000194 /LENGTH=106 /DNA_ID=CAMNT_0016347377 /DNA_START=197 /DNA_END=514 /DNA_ORIENTATION=+
MAVQHCNSSSDISFMLNDNVTSNKAEELFHGKQGLCSLDSNDVDLKCALPLDLKSIAKEIFEEIEGRMQGTSKSLSNSGDNISNDGVLHGRDISTVGHRERGPSDS